MHNAVPTSADLHLVGTTNLKNDCKLELLANTTKQGNVPYSVFPKNTTEWREWVSNRDHVVHKHGALTTRPYCRHLEARMPSVARLFKRFRAVRTIGRLDLSLSWRASKDLLKIPYNI